ncbi:unnamed protein product [Chondrus crispus]|uniref:Phosphatidylinositol-specific phospholipase C X domain-containing protein n=1 Tax=Chondrus crispus TaxID=2769 RepID=R7QUA3_CHOCR|nr:unnamed protein product [Chondrus crispus]CDF41273.1 unnamed protein product [Chondrus crispus]|eukprot:XP_005711567.1 unnamed protein product [Chondrus crispus]
MSQLPDDTPLHKVSIPGTHDTGALHGGRICETQRWTVAEQLRAGIRFLDIRCRRDGTSFAIHHGFCFQKMYFEDVLRDVSMFLASSPGETILMRVKEEYIPRAGSSSLQAIWDSYMDEFGTLFEQSALAGIPTLGSVRG